jgi:polysaccharide biosynthesis/export protein
MIDKLFQARHETGTREVNFRRHALIALVAATTLGSMGTLTAQEAIPQQKSGASVTAEKEGRASAPPESLEGSPGYFPINRGDVLDVVVFDEPQLSCQCTVGQAGTIILPLLKPVKAQGLTPNQLADAVAAALLQSGLLSQPRVTVTVRSTPSSIVAVQGAVRSPQAVQVQGQAKLLDVLLQTGGLTDDAGDTATVFRGAFALRNDLSGGSAKSKSITVDVKTLIDGSDSSQNIDVFPGDRVSVERAGLFYVMGEVGRPGGYNLKSANERITVLQALAISGDVGPTAKKKDVFILRKDPKARGGRNQIDLNLTAILARNAPDPELQANDILFIPSSGRKRALRGFTSTAQALVAPTTTALIIYRR